MASQICGGVFGIVRFKTKHVICHVNSRLLHHESLGLLIVSSKFFSNSPIHDLSLTVIAHHDIGRFEVAVNHPTLMHKCHRLTSLQKEIQGCRPIGRCRITAR